jgi:hypothetical protein
MNYNGKIFRVVSNSDNGETSINLVFEYIQKGNVLTCEYSGEQIIQGQLIGLVSEEGIINMSYQQVNDRNEMKTGICTSTPEVLDNGKIRLQEKWEWTSGDKSKGRSTLDEI